MCFTCPPLTVWSHLALLGQRTMLCSFLFMTVRVLDTHFWNKHNHPSEIRKDTEFCKAFAYSSPFKDQLLYQGLVGDENHQDPDLICLEPSQRFLLPQLLLDPFLNQGKITDTVLCAHRDEYRQSSCCTELHRWQANICLVSLWFSGLQEYPKHLQTKKKKAKFCWFMFYSPCELVTALNKIQGFANLCLRITISAMLSVL